jgi:hypothetical protein
MDEQEREEYERELKKKLQEVEASLKKPMDSMMNGMIEAMAPMMGGAQLLGDEAKAWDEHACACTKLIGVAGVASGGIVAMDTIVGQVVLYADKMLAERRKRFNKEIFTEQMRGFLPSGRGMCNKPVLRADGADTGTRCTRNVDHPGDAHY